jgi:hypothetical protein
MGEAIIGKLTDKIYVVRAGKNSLETIDYIAYIASPESSEPIKILNIKEIQNNVKEGLTKLIEPLLDKKDIDFNKDFNKFIAFIFLLKAKLYLDYILKRSLNRISIMNVMNLRKEAPAVAYQIALYLKDNDPDVVLPEPYQKVLLDQELFEKFFKIIEDVTFRSNEYIVKRAFMNFSAEISKFFQN